MLGQSANRVRVLALLYAGVFFMAGFFPALLFEADRTLLFSKFTLWGPGTIAITVALLVAAVMRSSRVPLPVAMYIALAFEVASCYGIATAEFLDPAAIDVNVRWLGLSWVAPWTLLFTVVVPTRPWRAVTTALLSVSSVPVTIGTMMAVGFTSFNPDPLQFFFWLVFPYLLVVVMAYVGARVVYALGTEVSRARELGSYRLVDRLGQGGMGEVWSAKHSMLARPAAIKLIRPSLIAGGVSAVSDEMQRRFEREAQVIARLRSPHTVTLFDFGVAPDGAFYYVMELLEGLDAETLVRRHGPIPADRTIHVLRQMCHSLSEAESCGLVHRDIKPANIFLCRYGEEFDFVKVLDFGIAKAAHETPDAGMTLTTRSGRAGHAGFHCPRAGAGRIRYRWASRHLCHRVRGLLAVDRAAGVHGRHAHGASASPREDDADPAFGPHRAADPRRARAARDVLPGQGSGGPPAIGAGVVAPARGARGLGRLDSGPGSCLVDAARAGGAAPVVPALGVCDRTRHRRVMTRSPHTARDGRLPSGRRTSRSPSRTVPSSSTADTP